MSRKLISGDNWIPDSRENKDDLDTPHIFHKWLKFNKFKRKRVEEDNERSHKRKQPENDDDVSSIEKDLEGLNSNYPII